MIATESPICINTIKTVTHIFNAEIVTCISAIETYNCMIATETVTCMIATEISTNINVTENIATDFVTSIIAIESVIYIVATETATCRIAYITSDFNFLIFLHFINQKTLNGSLAQRLKLIFKFSSIKRQIKTEERIVNIL